MMISNIFSKNHSFPTNNLKNYLKKRNFCAHYFTRVIFLTFHVDLISRIAFRWIFRKDLFSRILVLYILIFCGLFYS